MTHWVNAISAFMNRCNQLWDSLKHYILDQLGIKDPILITPYRSYGTPSHIYLKGRVLQDEGIKLREEDASVWKNLHNMYRRFESDEVPGAKLQVNFANQQHQVTTDKEGFFNLTLELQPPLEDDRLWQPVSLELLHPKPDPTQPVKTEGEVIIVSDRAHFGVISDIDDTLIRTAATDVLKMIRIAYLGNERTRSAFPGVPAFYHGLQQGQSGQASNPIFYVSSSAWNMYDLFVKALNFNHLPAGPILLRDVELSPANLLSFDHQQHKMEQIAPILDCYVDLPFILIGDSGQKDAEIYHQIVQQYPDRILAIYLHDVTPDNSQRHQELLSIAAAVQQAGSEFVLFTNSLAAANHALEQGWISQESWSAVQEKNPG